MKRRTFVAAGGAVTALFASRGIAQGTRTPRRIAILSSASVASYGHYLEEFRASLKSLGNVEGRDIVFDVRWAENRLERLPALVTELLELKPAVIVTHGSPGVVACKNATTTVPIVFAAAGDPIGQGFIKSYPRPGGNITGVAFNEEINKKIYEVVKAVMPAASRIATLVNVKNPAQKHHLDDVPVMAKALVFESILVHATKEEELEAAFEHAVKAKAHALVIASVAPFTALNTRIVELQNKHRIPTFHGIGEAVQAGAVASYTFPYVENWRRAAALVDKVLKGVSPAEIPVEIPTRYEIAVNLKAAKTLGITVPQSFVMRANKVIE